MSSKGYTVLGWAVWQVATWFARRKIRQNRVKVGAAAAVFAVLVLGIAAARSDSD